MPTTLGVIVNMTPLTVVSVSHLAHLKRRAVHAPCTYTCKCICICTCTYTCKCICICTCTYTCKCICICTCTYTCKCICICTCTCTCLPRILRSIHQFYCMWKLCVGELHGVIMSDYESLYYACHNFKDSRINWSSAVYLMIDNGLHIQTQNHLYPVIFPKSC